MGHLLIIMKIFLSALACVLLHSSYGRLLNRGSGDSVDLHNEEFCTDVSQYSDKYYKDETERCCTTTYEHNCVAKEVVVSHVKMVPHCEDKTSLNCETGWKVV